MKKNKILIQEEDTTLQVVKEDGASPPNIIVLKAPATTANLGPGFDVFGMALETPNDKVTIIKRPKNVKIEVSGIASESIPTDLTRNTAGVVAKQILEEFSLKTGLLIKLQKGILPGVGLGSSAASAAAVAFGLNQLFFLELRQKELVKLAARGERASAGFEHADNVSAAIYGGFTIVKTRPAFDVIHLEPPPNLRVCIAIPQMPPVAKKTEKARSVLPRMVSLNNVIQNIGHAARMAVGFARGELDLVGSSMVDAVVEPARAFLIPGYNKVRELALEAGAIGLAISGAGPAMIALVDIKKTQPSEVLDAMQEGFNEAGVKAVTIVTKPGKGISLVEVI